MTANTVALSTEMLGNIEGQLNYLQQLVQAARRRGTLNPDEFRAYAQLHDKLQRCVDHASYADSLSAPV